MYKTLWSEVNAIASLMREAMDNLDESVSMLNQLSRWEQAGGGVSEHQLTQIREVLGWACKRFSLGTGLLEVIHDITAWEVGGERELG